MQNESYRVNESLAAQVIQTQKTDAVDTLDAHLVLQKLELSACMGQ